MNFGDKVEHIPASLFCPYSIGASESPNITVVNFSQSINSVGNGAFSNCPNIQTVNYPGTMSQWCAINFASSTSNPAYYATSLVIDEEEVPENFILPEEVTSISAYAFAGYSKPKSITLPESITSIGDYAFAHCTSLTTIDLSNCTNMDTIGSAVFYNCTNLNSVVINEYVFSNVTSWSPSCGYLLAYLQSGEGTVYVPEEIINELGHTNEYLNSSFTLQSDTAVGGYYIYVKN